MSQVIDQSWQNERTSGSSSNLQILWIPRWPWKLYRLAHNLWITTKTYAPWCFCGPSHQWLMLQHRQQTAASVRQNAPQIRTRQSKTADFSPGVQHSWLPQPNSVVYGEVYGCGMSTSGRQCREGRSWSAESPPLSALPSADWHPSAVSLAIQHICPNMWKHDAVVHKTGST